MSLERGEAEVPHRGHAHAGHALPLRALLRGLRLVLQPVPPRSRSALQGTVVSALLIHLQLQHLYYKMKVKA